MKSARKAPAREGGVQAAEQKKMARQLEKPNNLIQPGRIRRPRQENPARNGAHPTPEKKYSCGKGP